MPVPRAWYRSDAISSMPLSEPQAHLMLSPTRAVAAEHPPAPAVRLSAASCILFPEHENRTGKPADRSRSQPITHRRLKH
jgi:hypothetical protein